MKKKNLTLEFISAIAYMSYLTNQSKQLPLKSFTFLYFKLLTIYSVSYIKVWY